jgi:LPXTG-motif cell wall-anchored protein
MELRPGVTQGTWKDLEKVDEDYNYYIYTVKEVDSKGNDYEPPHFRKTEEGLTVTNTHTAGAPVTGETLSVYTIMGAMLMALAALFLILTGRKRAKAK